MDSHLAPSAYLQQPSIYHESIVFMTDDDLWLVSIHGGQARRLTNSLGLTSSPVISPDGSTIAYLANDHGQNDIFTIPLMGGIPKRITYVGVSRISGWADDKSILFSSNHDTFSARVTMLHEINTLSLKSTPLNLGHCSTIQTQGSVRVLGKNLGDPARWKRYRGGTAGTLWIDQLGRDQFKQVLPRIKSNFANPLIIEKRLYFISDHEGIGNIYSCTFNGAGLKRHTHCEKFYVRNFSYSQGIICFQAGADLFLLDLKSGTTQEIEVIVSSSFNQSTERIESIQNFLQEYSIDPRGREIGIVARGKIFSHKPWTDAALLCGNTNNRYKNQTYLFSDNDSTSIVAVELDHENEERLVLFKKEKDKIPKQSPTLLLSKHDWGKIESITPHPSKEIISITNNRNELYILTLKSKKLELIAKNEFNYFDSSSWSPCGRYLAYTTLTSRTVSSLAIYDTRTKKTRIPLPGVLADYSPVFDPNGKYLYFISMREFHPNYAETHFDLSFPFASKPYALVLQEDCQSPFDQFLGHDLSDDDDEGDQENDQEEENQKEEPRATTSKKVNRSKKKTTKTKLKTKKKKTTDKAPSKESQKLLEDQETTIDWDGLENRVIPFPVELGGHRQIKAVDDKVFFLKGDVSGIDPNDPSMEDEGPTDLYTYCFKENKKEIYQKDCSGFQISLNGKFILMDCEDGLRLVPSDSKPNDGDDYNKKNGHIDLYDIKLTVNPKQEWKQMYREAWILQREHFWAEDMSKINWVKVFKNYLPLLEKVNTRKEFSDLIWEMQGELGTSHCYEFGGHYKRRANNERSGQLVAQTSWSARDKSYTLSKIAHGDSWISSSSSPLTEAGVSLKNGDKICGVNGRLFEKINDLNLSLVARANKKTQFIIKRKNSKDFEQVNITPSSSAHAVRYRDWVEANRKFVHRKSKGKLGYIHVPDMGVQGFSEFWRGLLSECPKDGLVVDIRYNGGGHISQHLLKILAQKIQGFDKTRHMGIEPYPMYAINGPIVAITNEHAGSDGDIFSHSFKLMKLGPLIGKRTWGGVIGIWPRHPLNDGSMTSQPEFSYWFKDVGYDVENYGTDPDIEVEITPKDWKEGKDPQLERAILEAQKLSKKNPPLRPNLNLKRPNLSIPKLPKI